MPWALALLLALRALGLAAGPRLSDDLYRYVWEGDLVAQGRSPYQHAPDAAELAQQRARLPEVFARVNHPEVSAAYPVFTQLVHGALAQGLDARDSAPVRVGPRRLRLFALLCDLATLGPLLVLLRRRGLPWIRAWVWGAAPLVAVEFAGAGHFDALGILLLLGALACLPERPQARASAREAWGLLLLTASIWTKLLPLLVLPFVLRGPGWARRLAWVLGASLVLHSPLLLWEGGAEGWLRGLGSYGAQWEGGSLLYRWVVRGASLVGLSLGQASGLGRALALLGLALVGLGLWRRRASALEALPVLLGAFALLTPMLHPWYLAWLLPCLAWRPRLVWLSLVAASPWLYTPLQGWQAHGVWHEPAWVWWALALPLAGAWLLDRRRLRAATP